MALTTEELAELAQARADLAAINGGRQVRVVQNGSRRLENAPGDAGALQRRIDQLEALNTTCRRRGAVRFTL